MAERALDLMKRRSLSRTAFGKLLAEKVRNFYLTQLLHILCNSSILNVQKLCTFVPSTNVLCSKVSVVPSPTLSGPHVD